MANAADLTGTLDRLEERVANHITFFRLAVGAGVVWLGAISVTLFTMNGTLNRLGQLQANSPARTAQALLKSPIKSKDEAAGNLAAVAAVLRSAPSRNTTKPDPTVLNSVSADIVKAQVQYPDLPETWQATAAFINYKFDAALLPDATAYQASGKPCSFSASAAMVFSHCELKLEDLENRIHDNFVNGQRAPFVFIACIVHYGGGPLRHEQLIFQNSVLRFDISTLPSDVGMVALRQLTVAQPLETVKLSL